jgi:hypothetical protein
MGVLFEPGQDVVEFGALGERAGGHPVAQDELRLPAAAVQGRNRRPGGVRGHIPVAV